MKILFSDARCIGGHTLTRQPLGICIDCSRRYSTARERIEPEPIKRPGGEWDCPNRRFDAFTEAEADLPGE